MKELVGVESGFHLENNRRNRNNNYFYTSQLRLLTPIDVCVKNCYFIYIYVYICIYMCVCVYIYIYAVQQDTNIFND